MAHQITSHIHKTILLLNVTILQLLCDHLKFVYFTATEKARKLTKCELDIQYHENGSALDIYYPDNGKMMFVYNFWYPMCSLIETGLYSDNPVFVYMVETGIFLGLLNCTVHVYAECFIYTCTIRHKSVVDI